MSKLKNFILKNILEIIKNYFDLVFYFKNFNFKIFMKSIIFFNYNFLLYTLFLIIIGCLSILYLYFFHNFYSSLSFMYIFSVNIFNVTLLFLSLFVSFLSILLFDSKFKNKKILYIVFFSFNLFLLLFLFTNNFLSFFICYELLLLPSTFLVYFSSPNLRSKNVSFYFLLWTQLGSFIVFLAILILIKKNDIYLFKHIYYLNMSKSEYIFISFLLFFGFGIKIPIFPFHFWLTKTHVEANTGFSIFLSGILVKTALYGIFKFSYFLVNLNILFLIICFISLFDVFIKLISQTDLKKIIAFCTVFEMNIILINLIYLNLFSYYFLILFCILHTILSALFFIIVDCIFKRTNSRSLNGLNNLINYYPIMSNVIIISVLFFNGLPLSLKFNLEIVFFSKLIYLNFLYFFIFSFIEVWMIILFTKFFFKTLTGFKQIKYTSDLSKKEIIIFFYLTILNFFICFL